MPAKNNLKPRMAQGSHSCCRCLKVKPWTQFSGAGHYADGTPRISSQCRECRALMARQRKERQTTSEIYRTVAPRAAFQRLVEEHPEIIDEVAKKYRFRYLELLEEERQRLMAYRAQYLEKVRVYYKRNGRR